MVERIFDKLIRALERLKYLCLTFRMRSLIRKNAVLTTADRQDLDIYWDESFADELSTWGTDTAWREVQFLLLNRRGRVLDIACGCGAVMRVLRGLGDCELYGCDISSFLIGRAIKSGIPGNRLTVCDARRLPFPNGTFAYSYSIGSLEHFTEEGIRDFIEESRRVTSLTSFHQIPTSRSGRDEGWIRPGQSYFNNSVEWWLKRFRASYDQVFVLNSSWEDPISVGRWFVCVKDSIAPRLRQAETTTAAGRPAP